MASSSLVVAHKKEKKFPRILLLENLDCFTTGGPLGFSVVFCFQNSDLNVQDEESDNPRIQKSKNQEPKARS